MKGAWIGPGEGLKEPKGVRELVTRYRDAGFNALFVNVKGAGAIYWPSERFSTAIAKGWDEVDFPALLLEECRRQGMQFHAWFINFMEGGAVAREHPEWSSLNPEGNTTRSEVLRGNDFRFQWMCPAQRPGFSDQWLIPMMAEFAERYDVDSIHHDYIRYPGDLAPDRYCFCDYCLEHFPRWAGYYSATHPDEDFLHETYDRPYLEAHWETSPRVLPRNWDAYSRSMKSKFLLDEGFFRGGRPDLDYFYYAWRIHVIEEFAREAKEAIVAARPGMKISAALFKNPIHSGRFIGQDWRRLAPSIDYCIPMDYRSHLPGDFDTHLDLLEEAVRDQVAWAREYEKLWIGVSVHNLYYEEQSSQVPVKQWPGEKILQAAERVRAAGVNGIVLFSGGHLDSYDKWDAAARM